MATITIEEANRKYGQACMHLQARQNKLLALKGELPLETKADDPINTGMYVFVETALEKILFIYSCVQDVDAQIEAILNPQAIDPMQTAIPLEQRAKAACVQMGIDWPTVS